jgi:hypothetical protein
MIRGEGRWQLGRWWFYLNTNHQSVGRTRVGDVSVIYSFLILVAEHHRPEGYARRMAEANRERIIRRWQKTARTLYQHTEWLVPLADGETLNAWSARRWRRAVVLYENRAAPQRARGHFVPTIRALAAYDLAALDVPLTAYIRTS